jgi:hypothetical protein
VEQCTEKVGAIHEKLGLCDTPSPHLSSSAHGKATRRVDLNQTSQSPDRRSSASQAVASFSLQEIMEQKKSIYSIGRYQETGLARCLPEEEVTRLNQVATKLEENVRAYRSIIQGQGGFKSVSDDCDRLLRLQDVRDDNFDAFFLSRQFLHLAQVMDQSDSLEFVNLSIFWPADAFKGSEADALKKKKMSFEVSLQQAIAEAAGNLKEYVSV